jgi:NAD(P)-dependent dehydrogenase (short-subunit alcohol dehydrogenase family)
MPDLKTGYNLIRFTHQRKARPMFEKGLLAGKRILVTGGSGLGAAMGQRFVELGAELIICGRRTELLEQTAARLRGDLGRKVGTVRCDCAGYINGEMVLQDSGAHLRGSGAEGLLQWTDARWAEQRAARSKN